MSYPDASVDTRFVDWVNYEERNRASDPAAFAEAVLGDLADGARVWVIWNGAYKTFEGKCGGLIDAFGEQTQSGEVVTNADGATFFEASNLYVYGAVQ